MNWSADFPAARPPEGLRHSEARAEQRDDGTRVLCRVYEWQIILAEKQSNGWILIAGKCRCVMPLDSTVPVHAVVWGSWSAALDARAWRKYGMRWALFVPPEEP